MSKRIKPKAEYSLEVEGKTIKSPSEVHSSVLRDYEKEWADYVTEEARLLTAFDDE